MKHDTARRVLLAYIDVAMHALDSAARIAATCKLIPERDMLEKAEFELRKISGAVATPMLDRKRGRGRQ